MRLWACAALVAALCLGGRAARAADLGLVKQDFPFVSSLDNTGPLYARAAFQRGASHLPMVVVQHGYAGRRNDVKATLQRLALRGYFCLAVDTRGCGGSSGKRDDGGVEIMDIYDAVQVALRRYASQVDENRILMIGYSNGGANTYFSCVRFPYLFQGALAFFGIPDYGKWAELQPRFRAQVLKAVGATPDQAPDKFAVRNAALAAGNLGSMPFTIAYDEEESLCPPAMPEAFVAAGEKAGAKGITVNVSHKGDPGRWIHGYNDDGHLTLMEDRFLDEMGKLPPGPREMPESGELVVLGYLVTPRFQVVLGKGSDAVALLKYDLHGDTARFEFTPITSNHEVKARVTLSKPPAGRAVEVVAAGVSKGLADPRRPVQGETAITSSIEFRPPAPAVGGGQ